MQNAQIEIFDIIGGGEPARETSRAHGGNIAEAAKQYDIEEKKIVDFSSSVNPLGPSSAAKRAAKRAISSLDRYPDPDLRELRSAIAKYFGVKSDHVMCGSGSNSLLHLIPRVFKPKKVLVPFPTFTEYAVAVEDAGGEVVPFPLLERQGFRVDPLEMSFALKGMDMAFLCNPNNPTGYLIPKADMLEIIQYAREYNVKLIVDEAFMDFTHADSIVKDAVESSHLICLRSFTKFFGMPGLRVGYALSGEKNCAALRNAQEPWAVNRPAEQAAIAALGDWSYVKKTRRLVQKERERMLSALRILPGVETYSGVANFLFIKITSLDVPTFIKRLGERGMLVRDCSSFPGLDGSYIRIGVRTARENKRLIKAFRELLVR